jgi:nitrous oxidase accessory protein NosD
MVTINAPGVTWEGFCIQNVAGEGIEVLEPNVTVRGCAFYAMYSTAIQCNDTAERDTHHVVIEDCDIVWTSLRTFALGENEASGAIKFGNTGAGNVIRNVRLWLAGGEGFNIGKRTRATAAEPFVIEGCSLYDPNHTALYAVQAQHILFEGNVVVYHENVNPFTKAGTKAGGRPCVSKTRIARVRPSTAATCAFMAI